MYKYDYQDLFYVDGTNKQFVIAIEQEESQEPIYLTNSDLKDDSFEYTDGLMDSDSLNFANCISSFVRFVTYNTTSYIGKTISVHEIMQFDTENPIPLGIFKIQADVLSTDETTREIYAYDLLFDVINADVTDWYNSLDFPITQKDFRDSFFGEFGLEQDNTILINDDISFPKQLSENDLLSGQVVIKALCDMNGAFCHMGKDGLVHWIYLEQKGTKQAPLYPSLTTYPGVKTYPGNYVELQDIYRSYYKEDTVLFSNYKTLKIDGIQIRNDVNEIAYQTKENAENPYTVIGNFLCYNLSYAQYETIAHRLLNVLKEIEYTPFSVTKMGDPCMEVGDKVIVHTLDKNNEEKTFISFIFTKHTTGILEQWDEVTGPGEYYLEQYDIGTANSNANKIKNLDQRVGNLEKSGSGPIQIRSVEALPETVELNVLYLIQGEVMVN